MPQLQRTPPPPTPTPPPGPEDSTGRPSSANTEPHAWVSPSRREDRGGGGGGPPGRPGRSVGEAFTRLLSGYYSDSAVEQRSPRMRRRPNGRPLDSAREPLMGLEEGPSEIYMGDSDREGPHTHEPREYARSYDPAPQGPDYDPYRSPHEMQQFIPPRKSRWTKKVTRKRSARPPPAVRKGRLAAYCISSELQTEKLQAWLVAKRKERTAGAFPIGGSGGGSYTLKLSKTTSAIAEQLVGPAWSFKMYMGVVYYTNDDGQMDPLEAKHIYVFPYGCAIFWGCTKHEEEVFIKMIEEFAVDPVSAEEREESYDDFVYLYGENPKIYNYEITLTSNDPEEKLALSFSLAQSAKLFVFENRVDEVIGLAKSIPLELATQGRITMSRKDISKLTGKVFLERNEVNLHSDVLDTPEWFWEKDLHEPLYKKFCLYLDIPNRTEILNKRLDILRELLDVLNTQLENCEPRPRPVSSVERDSLTDIFVSRHMASQCSTPLTRPAHSTKLELIVIALIIVEVVLQVLEIFLDDFRGGWAAPM